MIILANNVKWSSLSVRYELNVIYSQAVVDCSKQLKNSHEYNVIGEKKKIQMIVITYGCNCQITDLPPLILRYWIVVIIMSILSVDVADSFHGEHKTKTK